MKTIIEFKDGHIETVEDGCPTFDLEGESSTLSCMDAQCGGLTDDVPLTLVKRVVFEP